MRVFRDFVNCGMSYRQHSVLTSWQDSSRQTARRLALLAPKEGWGGESCFVGRIILFEVRVRLTTPLTKTVAISRYLKRFWFTMGSA
jgi:hypothetical protein